jgi:negative regulator of flagellin synthesis FlgM
MKETDNNMNVRPPRTDVSHGSQTTSTRATSSSGSVSGPSGNQNPVSGDTVTLTNSVDQMARLEEMLASIPEVDSARVAEIKASIADGSYQVDPEKIVDKLLQIEKDFS